MVLPESFYTRDNVVTIARELLGKVLVTSFDGKVTSGIITETEAYAGITDKASHAYGDRRTTRTAPMYGTGGISYVYLCYGIHHLFNVVTNVAGIPHAVLIRAIEPVSGIDEMLVRRKKSTLSPSLTAGPGALSKALGIDRSQTGASLLGGQLYIESHEDSTAPDAIVAGTRVGVAYAGEDALLPYRFWLKDNKYVSRAKGL
jgi:DNA-3-methyladenine glycosylase